MGSNLQTAGNTKEKNPFMEVQKMKDLRARKPAPTSSPL